MSEKADLYSIIESLATSSLALKRYVYVPEHITEDSTARQVIDGHTWGTHGKSGKERVRSVFLKDCETEHLLNILRTQSQIPSITALVIIALLMERYSENLMKQSLVSIALDGGYNNKTEEKE